MIAKNTVDISIRNIKLMFKLILLTVILLTVLVVVLISIFSPVWDSLIGYFEDLTSTSDNFPEGLLEKAAEQIALFFAEESSALWATAGYSVLSIFLVKFIFSLTMVPTGSVLASQMTTGFTKKYLTTCIENIKKSISYSLIGSIISILLDIPFTVLIVYIGVSLSAPFGVFAFSTALILFVLYFAVRISLTSLWIPNIVVGELSPLKALFKTLKDTGETFKKVFVGNLAILSTITLVASATMFTTVLTSLVIIIPAFMLLFLVFSTVVYCHINKQNYFIAPQKTYIIDEE